MWQSYYNVRTVYVVPGQPKGGTSQSLASRILAWVRPCLAASTITTRNIGAIAGHPCLEP